MQIRTTNTPKTDQAPDDVRKLIRKSYYHHLTHLFPEQFKSECH